MQKFLILLLLVICTVFACKQPVPVSYLDLADSDWKKGNLKGRIKKMVETKYMPGVPYQQSVIEYNERGFIVHKTSSSQQADGRSVTVYVYRYDTSLNYTEIIKKVNSVQVQRELFHYDKNGKLDEYSVGKTGDTYVSNATTYTYDQQGRLLNERNYYYGASTGWIRNEYLADGSTKKTYFDDKEQQTLQRIEKDTIKIEEGLATKYEADKMIYVEEKDANNKLKRYYYYYNQYNDHVMTISNSAESKKYDTLIIKYTYDKFGNYMRRDSTCNRELTYY
jgi:hypothetical protein